MIKANELRLGNWVSEGNSYWQILSEDFDESILGGLDDFEPIALTPEILERCGFEANNGKRLYKDVWLVIHIESKEANLYDLYKNETLQIKIHCEYLHQLQNLYFALTGEELNVIL